MYLVGWFCVSHWVCSRYCGRNNKYINLWRWNLEIKLIYGDGLDSELSWVELKAKPGPKRPCSKKPAYRIDRSAWWKWDKSKNVCRWLGSQVWDLDLSLEKESGNLYLLGTLIRATLSLCFLPNFAISYSPASSPSYYNYHPRRVSIPFFLYQQHKYIHKLIFILWLALYP